MFPAKGSPSSRKPRPPGLRPADLLRLGLRPIGAYAPVGERGQETIGFELILTRILKSPVSSVIKAIKMVYKISEEDIFQGQRGKRNEVRQVAMYLIRELCAKSLKEIAELFSLGSYGGVGGACSAIEKQIKFDSTLRCRIAQIREMISSTSIQKKT